MSDGRVTRMSSVLLPLVDDCDEVVASVSPSSAVDVEAAGHLVNGRWTNAGSMGAAV